MKLELVITLMVMPLGDSFYVGHVYS